VGAPPIVLADALTTYKIFSIASGLECLHSNDQVRGDLKGVRHRS